MGLMGLPSYTAQAATYYEENSQLLFEYSDAYTIRDYTDTYNEGKPFNIQVKSYFLIGPGVESSTEGVFEVYLTVNDANTELEQLQLRTVNTQQLYNREILGTTGVELLGTSYTGNEVRRAYVLGMNVDTLVVVYKGEEQMEFESFLLNIQKTVGFSDTLKHPLRTEITDATEMGIFQGYTNPETNQKEFKPDQGINRAEFLKVLVLALPGVSQGVIDSFYITYKAQEDQLMAEAEANLDDEDYVVPEILLPDVDRDAWFAPYIFYALDKNWIQGYPDGTFRSTNLVNIAEAAKMILKSRGVFLAADEEVWFRPFMNYFDSKNVLVKVWEQYRFSFSDELFFSYNNCTRAQAAGFLARLIFLDENPGLTSFAKEIPLETLPFEFSADQPLQVYQLGRGVVANEGQNAYQIVSPSGAGVLATVAEYNPESWTLREKSSANLVASSELKYLSENSTFVYSIAKECISDPACSPSQFFLNTSNSFLIKDMDLSLYTDPNFDFEFWFAATLSFDVQQEVDVKTLTVSEIGAGEKVILSVFANKAADVPLYYGREQDFQRNIGNRDWLIYQDEVSGEARVTLITSFGPDLVVAAVRGVGKFTDLEAEVMRILRSIM